MNSKYKNKHKLYKETDMQTHTKNRKPAMIIKWHLISNKKLSLSRIQIHLEQEVVIVEHSQEKTKS